MIKMTQPTLYTRGTKLWVRFSLDGQVVKKSLNIEDTKANRKLALNQIVPQILLKVHSGEFFENKIVPTVKEMIDISLKMNESNRKYFTNEYYKMVLRTHVIPHFGNKKVDSLKPSELTLWQNNLLKRYSTKYTNTIRVVFNGILEDARRDEIIIRNPFSIVKTFKKSAKREIKTFSKDEIFEIIKEAPFRVRAFFAIGFFSGMRTGEITGLKWEDINLEKRTISIKRTRNKGIENSPKTISSIREIEILDILYPYIIEHKSIYGDMEYVFTSKFKQPFYSAVKITMIYWKKILKNLNIEYRTLYQMRHTFATMMIENGEDILWVAHMLGHTNANITLEVYAKYMKNDKKKRGTFLLN